jgi:Cft2 family RNA processing exonuclease
MLEDAARLAESDAETESRRRERKGLKPIVPWFDLRDVERVLKRFAPIQYGQEHQVLPGIRVRLDDAGHIIGSAITELWAEQGGTTSKLVFSGDLGPNNAPFLPIRQESRKPTRSSWRARTATACTNRAPAPWRSWARSSATPASAAAPC